MSNKPLPKCDQLSIIAICLTSEALPNVLSELAKLERETERERSFIAIFKCDQLSVIVKCLTLAARY